MSANVEKRLAEPSRIVGSTEGEAVSGRITSIEDRGVVAETPNLVAFGERSNTVLTKSGQSYNLHKSSLSAVVFIDGEPFVVQGYQTSADADDFSWLETDARDWLVKYASEHAGSIVVAGVPPLPNPGPRQPSAIDEANQRLTISAIGLAILLTFGTWYFYGVLSRRSSLRAQQWKRDEAARLQGTTDGKQDS